MSTTNYPSATPQSQPPRKDSKNLIIALLAVGILGTWGYFLYDKNKSDKNYQFKTVCRCRFCQE